MTMGAWSMSIQEGVMNPITSNNSEPSSTARQTFSLLSNQGQIKVKTSLNEMSVEI